MTYSLAAFQEPRGVMRILQFIFAICALATTANFTSTISLTCNSKPYTIEIAYPFNGAENDNYCKIPIDVSSDAQFFVATGVLSVMYCAFVIAVYGLFDELYRSKTEIPMADFMLTTVLAIFWLSGSAAWSNGTNALKTVTDPEKLLKVCMVDNKLCDLVSTSSFSRLNISLIIGFLNFFLWASDLWFLYKETIWFQGRAAQQQQQAQEAGTSVAGSPTV